MSDGNKLSDTFSITNGVKQGAVLSSILFCIYIDDLIKRLRRNRTGSWINGDFVGIIVYADDIVLLSPTLDGLQEMINTCSEYAKYHNLSFSTNHDPNKSKTKCMGFLKKKRILRNMQLDNKNLPWVNSVRYLGTTITDTLDDMNQDLLEKRAQYIAKNNELMQEFHYAHPYTKIMINNIFNTHFYGATLWDLFSSSFVRLEKTWNISQRLMLSFPRETHRYLIEPLSGRQHIIFSIRKRFLKFANCIAHSHKKVLRSVFKSVQLDCRSVTGRNLRNIMLSTNQDVYNDPINVRFNSPYNEITPGELWRISLLQEILEAKHGNLKVDNFLKKELDELVWYSCCT